MAIDWDARLERVDSVIDSLVSADEITKEINPSITKGKVKEEKLQPILDKKKAELDVINKEFETSVDATKTTITDFASGNKVEVTVDDLYERALLLENTIFSNVEGPISMSEKERKENLKEFQGLGGALLPDYNQILSGTGDAVVRFGNLKKLDANMVEYYATNYATETGTYFERGMQFGAGVDVTATGYLQWQDNKQQLASLLGSYIETGAKGPVDIQTGEEGDPFSIFTDDRMSKVIKYLNDDTVLPVSYAYEQEATREKLDSSGHMPHKSKEKQFRATDIEYLIPEIESYIREIDDPELTKVFNDYVESSKHAQLFTKAAMNQHLSNVIEYGSIRSKIQNTNVKDLLADPGYKGYLPEGSIESMLMGDTFKTYYSQFEGGLVEKYLGGGRHYEGVLAPGDLEQPIWSDMGVIQLAAKHYEENQNIPDEILRQLGFTGGVPIESDVNTDEFGYGHTEYTRLEKWSGKKAYEGDEPENVRNYLSTELIQELGGYLEEYTVEQQERIKALERVAKLVK